MYDLSASMAEVIRPGYHAHNVQAARRSTSQRRDTQPIAWVENGSENQAISQKMEPILDGGEYLGRYWSGQALTKQETPTKRWKRMTNPVGCRSDAGPETKME